MKPAPRPTFGWGWLLLAALLLCWQVGPMLGTHLIGIGGVDHFGTLWFHDQVWETLRQGDPRLWSGAQYHPWGVDLLGHTGANILDALLALPFRAVFGRLLGHNLFLLAILVANGLAALPLARASTPDRGAASLAALLFGLCPFALYELAEGRPTQALIAGFPLLLWALGAGRWALGGIILGLLGYQYWFYGLFGGLAVVIHGAFSGRARLRGHLGLLLAAGLLVSPVALPLLLRAAGGTVPGLIDLGGSGLPLRSVEGDAMLLYSWQPLSGVGLLGADALRIVQWPLGPLLPLFGLLWVAIARRRGPLLAVALLAGILAIGPVLLLGGAHEEPLYRGLLALLPPLRRLWHPARALALLSAVGVVWAASGLGWIRARRGGWLAAAIPLVALWALWARGLAPLPAWDPTPPAAVHCLAQGEDGGALIELPFGGSQEHLAWQGLHHRPILGGMLEGLPAFQPEEAVALRREDPFLSGILDRARGIDAPVGDPAAVRALGYRWVLLQKDALPPEAGSPPERARRRAILRGLAAALGEPLWEDARGSLWSLDGEGSPCVGSEPAPDAVPRAALPGVEERFVRELGSRSIR